MSNDSKKKKFTFNVFALIDLLKKDKRKMGICLCAFGIFGVIVAFSIPKRYEASVTLAPETASNGMLSSVSSLASMVGLYNDANPTGDAIYPEIYPDLMSSNDFLVSLFDVKVKSSDGTINTTYYNYLKDDQKKPWWSYPLDAVGKLLSMLGPKERVVASGDKVNPFDMTREQHSIAWAIEGSMGCSVDKMTNVITISVTDQDPLISATMVDSVKTVLQKFITDYRTTKARNDLKFMEKLFAEAKQNYDKARQQYAAFSDSNTDVVLASVRLKQEDLENDMQLQYNIYTQVAQQLQMARAKVQERTPAFTVIQEASVPFKHCNTPKVYYLAVFLFLGFICRLFVLVWKNKKELFMLA